MAGQERTVRFPASSNSDVEFLHIFQPKASKSHYRHIVSAAAIDVDEAGCMKDSEVFPRRRVICWRRNDVHIVT